MAVSFFRLCELMDANHGVESPDMDSTSSDSAPDEKSNALMTSGEEGPALRAIRSGMNLRKEECGNFWDDFMTIIGDADGVADLLEVPKETITGWTSKIKECMDKVQNSDDEEGSDKKSEMIPSSNEPPNDQEERGITYGPPDMRPTP